MASCYASVMEDRASRLPAHYHIQFACPEYAGQGMTLNLSTSGLCIITAKSITPGEGIYARLILSEGTADCIEFQSSIVRWCQYGRIGLEISLMEEADRRKLNLLLVELKRQTQTHALLPVRSSADDQLRLSWENNCSPVGKAPGGS